jgi:hypothetical protein
MQKPTTFLTSSEYLATWENFFKIWWPPHCPKRLLTLTGLSDLMACSQHTSHTRSHHMAVTITASIIVLGAVANSNKSCFLYLTCFSSLFLCSNGVVCIRNNIIVFVSILSCLLRICIGQDLLAFGTPFLNSW